MIVSVWRFAHLEFKDEKSAIDAHEVLSGKSMGDRMLTVDYFGAKSSNPATRKPFAADQLDPCKLFISRYPLDMTADELQVLFPNAESVELLSKQQGQPIGWDDLLGCVSNKHALALVGISEFIDWGILISHEIWR